MKEAYLIKLSGRVQGVGFRYFTRIQARRRKVTGWVRNHPDGSVEAYCEGEQEILRELAEILKKGPQGARVDSMELRKTALGSCSSFTIEF